MTTTAAFPALAESATDLPLVPKLAKTMRWWHIAFMLGLANLAFVVFGLVGLTKTGYAFDAQLTKPTAWMNRIVVVGIATVIAATASYVAASARTGARSASPTRARKSPAPRRGRACHPPERPDQPVLRRDSSSGRASRSSSQSGTQMPSSRPSAPRTQTLFNRPGEGVRLRMSMNGSTPQG
jgi:hypothetical protein